MDLQRLLLDINFTASSQPFSLYLTKTIHFLKDSQKSHVLPCGMNIQRKFARIEGMKDAHFQSEYVTPNIQFVIKHNPEPSEARRNPG